MTKNTTCLQQFHHRILITVALLMLQPGISAQITRGDTTSKKLALVFTGDEYGDGAEQITSTLKRRNIKASFFLTGNFYRNPRFAKVIRKLISDGHYLGSHSDKHLLYCDWTNRDSLLVTHDEFRNDLSNSYKELARWDIEKKDAYYFLPPYEWYNNTIVKWTNEFGLQLINFTPGTRSTADYTYPQMGKRYVNSNTIYQSIVDYEANSPSGMNGFILLLHIGTDPRRKDKFYKLLPALLDYLAGKGYQWLRIDELLHPATSFSP